MRVGGGAGAEGARNTEAVNVVVGGASGIGAAVAAALAGMTPLIVADRDLDRAREVATGCGPAAIPVECDVTNDAHISSLAARIGRLSALVVTAGGTNPDAIGRTVLETNLVGTAKLFRAFEPVVGPGSVGVGLGSLVAHAFSFSDSVLEVLDDPLRPDLADRMVALGVDVDDPSEAYNVSKRGIIRLCSRLGAVWGPRGGRTLSVSPGVIDTPLVRDAPGGLEGLQAAAKAWPLGRIGRADEVGAVIAFLCSDQASYVSGCDLLIDGALIGSGLPFMPPRDAPPS